MTEPIDQKHPITLVAILLLSALAIAGALYMMDKAQARQKPGGTEVEAPVIDVDVYTLARVDVPRVIQVRGAVAAVAEVTVVGEVPGVVTERAVDEGGQVRAGDVLLRIDETFHRLSVDRAVADLDQVEARLREAESAVEQARAQLNSVRATRDNMSREFERISELLKTGDAAKLEYDRARTARERAEADWTAAGAALRRAKDNHDVAKAARDLAKTALDEARTRLERCAVRSPITGRVSHFFVDAGEYATPAVPLVEVVRLDTLKMTVDLTGEQVGELGGFTAATFVPDADPSRAFSCRLHHVSPKIDPGSRRFPVEFRIDNGEETLLAGMYGQVTLECGTVRDVLRLPRESVFKNYGVESCLVVASHNDRLLAQMRHVQIRDVPGSLDELEVVTGLAEGDRVIVTRGRDLTAGTAVRIGRELASGASPAGAGF